MGLSVPLGFVTSNVREIYDKHTNLTLFTVMHFWLYWANLQLAAVTHWTILRSTQPHTNNTDHKPFHCTSAQSSERSLVRRSIRLFTEVKKLYSTYRFT